MFSVSLARRLLSQHHNLASNSSTQNLCTRITRASIPNGAKRSFVHPQYRRHCPLPCMPKILRVREPKHPLGTLVHHLLTWCFVVESDWFTCNRRGIHQIFRLLLMVETPRALASKIRRLSLADASRTSVNRPSVLSPPTC